jgi:nucleoside-diphosphate-sugar epimerase
MSVLVTGASGFVGRQLCEELVQKRYKVVAAVRSANIPIDNVELVVLGAIDIATDWSVGLHNVDIVIHLAARVHVVNDTAIDSLSEFRKINVDATLNLARQAARLGVKRFIFLSSVKVNGEFTEKDVLFQANEQANPQDSYGVSKLEAESALMQLSKKTGMEVVIIRPPLVYGPGVKANFLSMMNWLNKSVPLPFGNITNKRSLVFIDNLVDLLVKVIDHPKAAGQVFLVSDDEDVSTTKLLQSLSIALGKKALLIKVPMCFLNITLRLVGKSGLSQRLLSSLQLDITKTKKLLDWTPTVSFEDGIKKTAAAYLEDLK